MIILDIRLCALTTWRNLGLDKNLFGVCYMSLKFRTHNMEVVLNEIRRSFE